ncbi:uncharacterized protein N0V89_007823 [Didymosphaeria variabile]|uniref:Prion-inhibition and propagation HeLo domain-containing protein n=1 Tax=Didymosphaeria variabile TaxID=1932322 RepID=A0A9W8XM86_9PLEO|nr:uncharacterized protein N0V89_007823 [Didymosphaeria variabile]KAJ4352475.1 hypothetical protein N0V89_007823 [Didymosphaeria variabile]
MEVGAGVAGLISLSFTAFRGCIQAFEFFNTAQHIGATGDLFSSKLFFQQYRLLQWGLRAGLDEDSKPDERLNWTLALRLLGQLESFMTSAEKLKAKYGFNIVDEGLPESKRFDASNRRRTGIEKIIARLKPDIYTAKGKIIQGNSGTFKRLQWAAGGRDQANQIISEIGNLIDSLESLLDMQNQQLRRKTDAILLRDVISRATTMEEVDEIKGILEQTTSADDQAILAAASLKHIRLVIGADRRNDEVQTAHSKKVTESLPIITKLKPRKLEPYTHGTTLSFHGLEFALYDGGAVLVEWKIADRAIWSELLDQVRCLAVLLASPDGSRSQSLHCKGYLPWQEQDRYGLVYDIPNASPKDLPGYWGIKSLYELILEEAHVSLTRRFEIATTLAETILQLHTAGWLHKSLRSQNIIFIAPKGSTMEEYLLSQPHLVGYEYARPDTPNAAKFSQLPDTELIMDLYRHPQARGISRERFQKRFDIYAFGCVLIELALWTHVLDVHTKYRGSDLRMLIAEAMEANQAMELPHFESSAALDKVVKAVAHHAGTIMAETVQLSLLLQKSPDDQFDVSLNTQQTIVDNLQQRRY